MKKVIFSAIFVFVCATVNAQIYEPYILGQSSTNTYNNQPQARKRIMQTTAYYINDNGNYAKVPIKVTIDDSHSDNDYVTSFYGYNDGSWHDCCRDYAKITKCSPYFGDDLETKFMYKAYLLTLRTTVYFDL